MNCVFCKMTINQIIYFLVKISVFSVVMGQPIANNGCNYIIKSNKGIYYGCTQMVSTESLYGHPDQYKDIYTFKGIPYAKPPIGELRFQKPEPIIYDKMTEVNASDFKKSCKQPPLASAQYRDFYDSSEDCLHLNIYTPSLDRLSNLPVMVYIHGGAFLFDSSRQVPGEQLSIRDVVVVTLNYRLGVFGFLCTDREDAPGNLGLWDQAMAMNWTQRNIRSFGGNPEDITIFGQNAGAVSVSSHIVSTVSRNYFKSAIMESGSSLTNIWLRSKDYSTRVAKRFSKFVGCDRKADYVKCLRNKSAEDLLSAQSTAFLWNLNNSDARPWYSALLLEFVQCFGDEFLPKDVFSLLDSGNFYEDIVVLTGHTAIESMQFSYIFDLMKGKIKQPAARVAGALINKKLAKYDIQKVMINNESFDGLVAEEYTKSFSDTTVVSAESYFERQRLRSAVLHSYSDYLFVCPTVLFGKNLFRSQQFNGDVFQYYMSYASNQSNCKIAWCKRTHFDDVSLAFGRPFYMNGYSDSDKKMSSVLMDIFTGFAKTKKAPTVNNRDWPPYSVDEEGEVSLNYMELDSQNLGQIFLNRYIGNNGFKPEIIQNCRFWEPILRSLF